MRLPVDGSVTCGRTTPCDPARQAPPPSPFFLLTFWRCVRRPYIRRDRQEWQWNDGASPTPLTDGTVVLPDDKLNRYYQKGYS